MTAAALARSRAFPAALGLGSFVAVIALVELLIRVGIINRFIVPMPSDIIAAFPRVIREEDVLIPRCAIDWWYSAISWRTMSIGATYECLRHSRFALTMIEALSASFLVTIC